MHLPEPIFKDSIAYLIKHKSIEELKQNELKHWYSDNVIIFAELLKYQNYEPSFKDPFFQDFYNELKNEGYTPERTIDIIQHFMKIFFNIYHNKSINRNVVVNVMKLYPIINEKLFPFWVQNGRLQDLQNSYTFKANVRPETNNIPLNNILWTHDSYFNHFYGHLTHLDAIPILEEALRKEKDYIKKTEIAICLAYRYVEQNCIHKARKLLKRFKRLIFLKLYKAYYKHHMNNFSSITNNPIIKRIYLYSYTSIQYRRCLLNILMFLYRSEDDKKKKYRKIKQLIKKNNILQSILLNAISSIIRLDEIHFLQPFRPQQLIKLLEVHIDLYKLTGKLNKNFFMFLLEEFIASLYIKDYYHQRIFFKVQTTYELFFLLYRLVSVYYKEEVFNESSSI